MTRDEISSINLIDVVLAIEESFGVEIPDLDAAAFSSPRDIVEWLALRLAGKPVAGPAAPLLENLSRQRGAPELADRSDGTWRREQIEAVVHEILRAHALQEWSDSADPDEPVRASN